MTSRSRRWRLAGLCALAALAALSAAPLAAGASASAIGASALAVSGAAPAKIVGLEAPPRSELEQAVIGWVRALSAQQPFAEWAKAKPVIEALGPGTHGWLVTLRSSDGGQPVGYMVVYAAEDGTYRLGEYGTGPQPLFDQAALTRALIANGYISNSSTAYSAEKLYLHPFAAAWKVQVGSDTYWLDAKTDEWLPLDDEIWQQLAQTLASAAKAAPADAPQGGLEAIDAGRVNEAFDPYERLPWLMKEAPFDASDDKALVERLNANGHLRYISEPFGEGRMLYAIAVVGYERWSGGRIDVGLDMNGLRFVPLTALRAGGLFYR